MSKNTLFSVDTTLLLEHLYHAVTSLNMAAHSRHCC